mgnify:CR=1 FL=1
MYTGRRIFVAIGLVFLMTVALVAGFGYYLVSPANEAGRDRVVLVPEGATLRQVASGLASKDVIRGKRLFLLWGRLTASGREIKAGEYLLSSRMPPVEIMNVLRKGNVICHPLTIPEGYTAHQIAALLAEKHLLDAGSFQSVVFDPDSPKRYGLSAPSLEGFLYPDTYHFSRGLIASSVVQTMVRRFFEVIAPLREAIEQNSMALEQIVTIASLVEKETGRAEERPLIAGVFLNRLNRGMRLASDPTVIYGIKEFDGNLTRNDLKDPTPYNTYVIRGLPPGPIANPGIEAIRAVLYPAETDYLYFVSKNDGTHHFSETLSEHNRAVTVYQKNRAQMITRNP